MDDLKSVLRMTCKAMIPIGSVAEVRILSIGGRSGRNAAGWFGNADDMADAAFTYDTAACEGIYLTLNPVNVACLARSPNRIKDWCKTTTSDRDIVQRVWLPLDFDPIRPSGISSTEQELDAARARAREAAHWLESEIGLKPGLRAISGNGVHLLFRVDLPNDENATKLIQQCIHAVATKFGDKGSGIGIDTTVHNPSRIFKFYGTMARKGESLPDRPHRRSVLLKTDGQYPEFMDLPINIVPVLENLAAIGRQTMPTATTPRPAKAKTKAVASVVANPDAPKEFKNEAVDIEEFIARNQISVRKTEPWAGNGKRYILDHCLFDESHTNSSACLGRSEAGAVFYKCQHDTCATKTWKDVRALFPPGGSGECKASSPDTAAAKISDDEPWSVAKEIVTDIFSDPDTSQVIIRRHRESYYLYDHRRHCYREVSNDSIRVRITRWMGEMKQTTANRKISDVANSVNGVVTIPDELEMPFISKVDVQSGTATGDARTLNRISLKNGILDLDAMAEGKTAEDALTSHTPEWFSRVSLPFDFPITEEQAQCPTWHAFLDEILEGDGARKSVIQEMFGYCFFTDTSLEKFFILHGSGSNGKSTLLNVLSELLGEPNISSLTMEQMTDQYLLFRLYGMIANICGDMNQIEKLQEGILKTIVSGETVTSDRKYKDALQFRPRAKLIFATNTLPRFNDTSHGIWRRMIVIPFNYVVPADQIDVHLAGHLKTEMPGILLWAIEGMVRLKRQNAFTVSKVCNEEADNYRRQCFPILMFLEECTQQRPDETIEAKQLWDVYKRWCDAFGLRRPKPLHVFLKDVNGFLPKLKMNKPSAGLESRTEIKGLCIRYGIEHEVYGAVPTANETATLYEGAKGVL